MHDKTFERTGINEPDIVLDLLRQQGYSEIQSTGDEGNAAYTWKAGEQSEIRWLIFGEMEVEGETYRLSLLAGDWIILPPGESAQVQVGSMGAGYVEGKRINGG